MFYSPKFVFCKEKSMSRSVLLFKLAGGEASKWETISPSSKSFVYFIFTKSNRVLINLPCMSKVYRIIHDGYLVPGGNPEFKCSNILDPKLNIQIPPRLYISVEMKKNLNL